MSYDPVPLWLPKWGNGGGDCGAARAKLAKRATMADLANMMMLFGV